MRMHGHPRRVQGRRGRLAGATAAGACAALLGAACSGPAAHPPAFGPSQHAPAAQGSRPPPAPAPVSAPTSPRASASPTPVPTPTLAATPAPPAAGPPGCASGALTVAVGPENGAAGSLYYPLEFSNDSGRACTLSGYPGVAFAAGIGGRQIGGAAVRNPLFPAQVVTLDPGATAHASLQVAVAQNYPPSVCHPVTAHWLRIYPPNQFTPLYVSFTAVTCTGAVPSGSTLGIYVVRPGATGP